MEKGDETHDIFREEKDIFYTNKKKYHNMISDGIRNQEKHIQAFGVVKNGLPAEKIKKTPYNDIEFEEYTNEKIVSKYF